MEANFNLVSTPLVDQPFSYTGQRLDTESGLQYYRARYFDNDMGRFINRDPIGYHDGYNLYRGYFDIGGMDPSGLAVQLAIPLWIGVAAWAAANKVALAYGLTFAACMATPACRDAVLAAVKKVLDEAGDAIVDAMKAACRAQQEIYHQFDIKCDRCTTVRAKTCVVRIVRCSEAIENAACFFAKAAARTLYVSMGCEVILKYNSNHAGQISDALKAAFNCQVSAANNCGFLFP